MIKVHQEVFELYYLDHLVDELFNEIGEKSTMMSDQYKELILLMDLSEQARTGDWD